MDIGNRVTIYRKVTKDPSPWLNDMDYTIGLSGVVREIEGGDILINLDGESDSWWVPQTAVKHERK